LVGGIMSGVRVNSYAQKKRHKKIITSNNKDIVLIITCDEMKMDIVEKSSSNWNMADKQPAATIKC